MNIRKTSFFLLDKIKGGEIKRDFLDIYDRIENNKSNPEALISLLTYAAECVDIYKDYKGITELSKFPVVNKNKIRDNLDRHISNRFNKGKLSSTTTSGSTGTPFTIYFNPSKIKRHRAALMYWNEKAGAVLGKRLYYLRVWNNVNKKGRLAQLLQNIVPVEVSQFTKQSCRKFLAGISKYKKDVAILGFSSALIDLLQNMEPKDVPDNVKGMMAMSEHLPENVRLELQERFGCPVYARYSNMENGFIAQQFDNTGEYMINTADFIVEILKMDSDDRAPEGELGRIVVTDLFNYAMPFIRYDTGDLGSIRYREDGRAILSSVEGRKMDLIYDTKGDPVSSHMVSITLWSFKEVSQYQFIQKSAKEYLFRLNLQGKTFSREEELTSIIKKYLGDDAIIRFEYVSEIPVLNSGKRRYVINEHKV